MPVILLPLGDKRLTKILLKAEFSSPLDQCSRCDSKSCDSQKCPGQTLQLWPLEAVPLLGRPLVGRPLVMWPLVMWPLVLWPLLMWPLHEQPLLLQPLLVKPLVCYRCISFPVVIGNWSWLTELPDIQKYHKQQNIYSAGSFLGTMPVAELQQKYWFCSS